MSSNKRRVRDGSGRRVVDKYEYNIKADQIMKLIDRRDFKTAAKIADGIDWRRVRNINMLTNVGCVYQAVGRYADAKEIFQLARNRAPLGRRLVYQMADVCIDAKEFEEAERYIQEFSELAPKDTARFELLYQLSRRRGEPIEKQIAILEEFKKQDFDEKWSFELAKLYHKAGYDQKCIAACDELVLWFGEGQYVDKAMELKMLHAPLSPSQQEKYISRKKKQEAEEARAVSKTPKNYLEETYNTESLQAALTKSIQEIMEAEERKKASYPSGSSYFEEYQSEQEEREAMFAATRDLRREREKFKNMMTQPIPSLINKERNLSENLSISSAKGKADLEEPQKVFDTSNDTLGETGELGPVFEIPKEELEIPFGASEEEAEKNSGMVWEKTEDIFEKVKKEPVFPEKNSYSDIEQPKEKVLSKGGTVVLEESSNLELHEILPMQQKSKVSWQTEPEDRTEDFEELEEFQESEDLEESEGLQEWEDSEESEELQGSEEFEEIESFEDLKEETSFSEENFWGGEFYYQVPKEEEPEYIEVPFSLRELDANEIPPEVYYRIADYDPQPFLDKAIRQAESVQEEENEKRGMAEKSKKEKLEGTAEEVEEKNPVNRIEEDMRFQSKSLEELEEDFESRGEAEEQIESDNREEEPEYEVFPEGGTEEEFYQYIMTRSYGVERMPEDAFYQKAGYQERMPEDPIPSKPEESEELEYSYGVEKMPEDAYYEVPGYDPESFLINRTERQGLEEEILGQKPQITIQSKGKETRQKSGVKGQNRLERKSENLTEILPDLPKEEQHKKEESPLELSPEFKNIFANYLHLPGVEQQIAEVLSETERIGEEAETSMFGNILLMGEVKSGKTTLAVALIKAMNRLNGRKGRKVAKISGDRLNNKGIKESISRLAGADLIIEHAGEMRISTVTELLEAMGNYTGGMIVVLEDTRTSIERLLADVSQLSVYFTHQIELKECNIAEWAEAAKSYALENHYVVDDMAMLALSAKIDAVYVDKKNIMMEDVQDIIDDAIEKAERRNKKLFGRLFSKKKDSDSVLLRESDFS